MKKRLMFLMILLSLVLVPQSVAAQNQPTTMENQHEVMSVASRVLDGQEDGSGHQQPASPSVTEPETKVEESLGNAKRNDPIINAGSNTGASPLTTDERGEARILDTTVEVQSAISPVAQLGTSKSTTTPSEGDWRLTLNSYSVGPGKDRLLVVSAIENGGSANLSKITFAGDDLKKGIARGKTQIWYLALGDSETAMVGDIYIQYDRTVKISLTATAFQNVNQDVPVNNEVSGSALSLTVTSGSNDMVIDAIVADNVGAAGTGQMEQSKQTLSSGFDGENQPFSIIAAVSTEAGAESVDMSWASGSYIVHAALNIRNSVALPESEVTLADGLLTISDINGGDSNDALQISYAGGNYTIQDTGGLILTSTIAGATGGDTDTLVIPGTDVTGIKFDTLGGDDNVKIKSVPASLTGEFTIEAGDGTDTATIETSAIKAASIKLNDSVTLSQATTLTADEIDFGGGANSVSGSVDLTLAPATVANNIAVGGASDSGAAVLDISDTDLAALANGFTSITIGDATNGTGAVDVDSSTFNDPVTIVGGSINVDQLNAGSNAVNLTARTGDISTENDVAANTDVTGSPVTLNGDVAPGASSGQGQLLVDGNVTFTNGKSFNVELNGKTAGTQHDQVKVAGANRTVTLNNATLSATISGYTPESGDELVIIDNVNANSSVSGTFDGLAEGAEVTIDSHKAIITYGGGTDNNDVVLQFRAEIDVRGNGVSITNGGNTASTTDDIDFGNAVMLSDTITQTFTISNTGGVDLVLNGSPIVSNSGIFTLTTPPSSPIASGSASNFVIEFGPSTTGVHTATVTIANNDSDENPYTFDIKGTGVSIEMDVQGNSTSIANGHHTPSTTDYTNFGNAVMLSDTITRTFTISNTGTVDLTLNGSPKVSLSNSGIFTVTTPPTSPIASNTTSNFVIEFGPSTAGVHTATVSIANNDSDENPYTFVIQGTGTFIEMNVQGNSTTPSTNNYTNLGDAVMLSDTITRTFTISNTGTADLTLSGSPKVSLSNSGIFTVTTPPMSPVASGSASNFVIEFGPSITGVHTATVSIANNDSDENPYAFVIEGTGTFIEMDVQGNSTSIANGDHTPSTTDHTDFGNAVMLSETITRTFTISNTGTADLTLSGSPKVSLSNSGIFTVTTPPTSPIASGNTSNFVIEFGPSTAGVHTATVSIANNDSDQNPYRFVIQGTGKDTDGINDSIEDSVPGLNGSNTGDGNADGIPDSLQENVASLQGSTNDYVTLATNSGKRLVNVRPETAPTGAPTQTQFPYGHFSFDVTGLSTGEAVTVQLILHGNQSTPTTFWKYGPTPNNNSDHWYEFSYDGTTGAQANGNIITLHFVDGQRGDSDLTANGQIRDPGAPAINPSTPEPTPTPNQPPQVSTPMPDITVVEGAANQTINPFNYFTDPEGDLVFFYVTGNSNQSVVPNLPVGLELGNIDQIPIQFGVAGQTEITIQAKEMWSHATVEDTFIVTVLERPTISISKSVSDDSVEAGQQINYTIAITNSGPTTATNALISNSLPTGLTFVSGSISASGITTGTVGTTMPTLASGVTLVPKQSIKLTFAATINQELLANQTISNTAQLTATELTTFVQASNLITTIPPKLAISDVTVSEVDGSAPFGVTLSKASALPVTVNFATVNDTATEADYTPISGTLTIPAGETESEITVQIMDDELVEESETFSVQLTNPSHATITDEQALATITNNDYPPTSVELATLSTRHEHSTRYSGAMLMFLIAGGLLLTIRRKRE